MIEFDIETEFIQLDKLLKVCRVVSSGGEAHQLVDEGKVKLNGTIESRRRAKIRPGDRVQIGSETIIVNAKK
ncbi:MAG: RNA-binding S4 domain-containing protein [Bacteroidota bacterium]